MGVRKMVFGVLCAVSFFSFAGGVLWAQTTNETAANAMMPAVENKVEAPVPPVAAEVPGPAASMANVVSNEVSATPAVSLPATEEPKVADAKTTEWVWGEVVSVDPAKKQLVIKHLDYETYEEVQTIVQVDDKTLFENVANISEIKAADHLTADYKVINGVNVVDLIVVEKEVAGAPVTGADLPEAAKSEVVASAANSGNVSVAVPQESAPAAAGNVAVPVQAVPKNETTVSGK